MNHPNKSQRLRTYSGNFPVYHWCTVRAQEERLAPSISWAALQICRSVGQPIIDFNAGVPRDLPSSGGRLPSVC
jgi:hypothetical protein